MSEREREREREREIVICVLCTPVPIQAVVLVQLCTHSAARCYYCHPGRFNYYSGKSQLPCVFHPGCSKGISQTTLSYRL